MDYFSTMVQNESWYMMHGATDKELWDQICVMKPVGDMKVSFPGGGSSVVRVEFKRKEAYSTVGGSSEKVTREIFHVFPAIP